MKKILILVLLLTISTTSFSGANYQTGEKLINYIRSSNEMDRVYAMAYIQGVIDLEYTGFGSDGNGYICQMDEVTTNQLVQITKNYLEKHPETWKHTASILVIFAIGEVYPCKK